MSERKDLAVPSDVVFVYDGGLDGFLCCVFESVYSRQLPFDIVTAEEAQPTLMPQRLIETDTDTAERVRQSIVFKLSERTMDLIETVFMSCLNQRERAMLEFLLLAYREGPKTVDMLGHPIVAKLLKAEKHLLGEQHLLLGFVRFSDYDGKLAATITPKNFVLPFMARHFISRYSCENFMIYDRTHHVALIYENRKARIVPLEIQGFDQPSEQECLYRTLWKQFYNTIAIKERINPKCRMTHMPKRYWENMLEVQDLLR